VEDDSAEGRRKNPIPQRAADLGECRRGRHRHRAFCGTLTRHRTKIFGHCLIYSATITGSLTLTPS
jgi:hypothetical protein